MKIAVAEPLIQEVMNTLHLVRSLDGANIAIDNAIFRLSNKFHNMSVDVSYDKNVWDSTKFICMALCQRQLQHAATQGFLEGSQ